MARITKDIINRIEKGFDIRIKKGGKFYFFYKQEFADGEIGEWTCDIYKDDELIETNFIDDEDLLFEIKYI